MPSPVLRVAAAGSTGPNPPLLDQPGEPPGNRLARRLCPARPGVEDQRPHAALHRDLDDPLPHGPGADNADDIIRSVRVFHDPSPRSFEMVV